MTRRGSIQILHVATLSLGARDALTRVIQHNRSPSGCRLHFSRRRSRQKNLAPAPKFWRSRAEATTSSIAAMTFNRFDRRQPQFGSVGRRRGLLAAKSSRRGKQRLLVLTVRPSGVQ